MSYHVSVDVGTSYTAAAIIRTGGAGQDPQILPLGVRATCIPSLVFVDEAGSFLVGDAAERRGMLRPDCLAREFKRRVGDEVPLVMGDHAVLAEDLFASVVRHVVDHARDREGTRAASVTVTHPAAWGEHRISSIRSAVARTGIEDILLLSEPEAAALYYASQQRVAPGSTFAVYDLGGGTFDVTVLVKDEDTFTVLGEPAGLERLGGADFDQEVFAHVVRCLPERFADLDPTADETLQALARLRKECSEAKEALSADADATIPVYLPGSQAGIRLVRSEFEAMIEPGIDETVEVLRSALDQAGVDPGDLSAILLIGGSSRIPLVAQLLSRAFDRPLAVDADPKASIALGAALAAGVLQEERAGSYPAVAAVTEQQDPTAQLPVAAHFSAIPHRFVPQHGPAHGGSRRRTATRAALVIGAVALLGVGTATAAGIPTPLSALGSFAGGSPAEAAQPTSDAPGASRSAGSTPNAASTPNTGPTPNAGPTLLDRAQAALDGAVPGASPTGSDPADERDRSDRPTAKKSGGSGAGTTDSSSRATRDAAADPKSGAGRSSEAGKSSSRPAPSAASSDGPATAPGDRPTGSPVPSSPSAPSSPQSSVPTPAPGQGVPISPVPVGPPPTTPAPSVPVPTPAPGPTSTPVEPDPTSPAPTSPAPTPPTSTTPAPVNPDPSGPDPSTGDPSNPDPSTPDPGADDGGAAGSGAQADPTLQPQPPEPSSAPVGTPVPTEG